MEKENELEKVKERIDFLESQNIDVDNLLRESFKIPKCNLGFRCDKCPFEICQMIDEKREDNEEELI